MPDLRVDGEVKQVAIDRCINAGYTGRDEAAVQAHIEELEEDGIAPPDSVPTFYGLAPYTLLVDPGTIDVVGGATSGEAEFGILPTGEEWYVVAASDQTDRDLETQSIQLSKQVAPNVISKQAWRYSAVADHWDEIELRAWNTIEGERTLYQETTLAAIIEPEEIVSAVEDRYGGPLYGSAILSGTVATVSGDVRPGSRFEVELEDPILDRSLNIAYDVNEL